MCQIKKFYYMYGEGGIIMIIGVLLSLGFISLMIWYVNRHIEGALKDKQWLTRYVALMLTALLALFIVDKVVSFRIQLLSDEMSNGLFELIKSIVLVIFGYQFGGKGDDKEK
jgi:hypothetical protein